MKIGTLRLGAVSLIALSLAGCGGGDDASSGTPPVVSTPKQEDKFGANFGAAFRADANGTPSNPADGDIIPVSLTDDPVPLG